MKSVSSSSFLKKYGSRLNKAVGEIVKSEPKKDSFGDLPGGISGGIAQLVDCRIIKIKEGKPNAGEEIFFAAGTVILPHKHNGTYIKGLRTSITIPLYDTPTRTVKTVEEHLGEVFDVLTNLGIDRRSINLSNLESVMSALSEAKPMFRFRTWQGEPAKEGKYKDKPTRVQHVWQGVVELEEAEEENVKGKGSEPEDSSDEANEDDSEGEEGNEEFGTDWTESTDLEALGEAADNDDGGAKDRLTELALDAEFTQKQVDKSPSWAKLVELLKEKLEGKSEEDDGDSSDEEDEEQEDEESNEVEVGNVYHYKHKDPKTNKVKKIQVEVTKVGDDYAIIKDSNTDDMIINPKTKKPLQVSFSELEPA